jgi:nucleoside-diphosphate-sugar epimerase
MVDQRILVAGGAGFLGSHVARLSAGERPTWDRARRITDDRARSTSEWTRRPDFEALVKQVFGTDVAEKQLMHERGVA